MSALDIQIGGEHYKNAKIQPVQYIEANGLGFLEGCVVKRVTRHDEPTGKGRQDIEKAIHELQLLLEFRYPQAPSTEARGSLFSGPIIHTVTNPPGEDIYAEFAARLGAAPTIVLPATPTACLECGYPTDAAGTHYATCSQLTAPEEYKAEAQVAFDEATEISEALARQVSAGKVDIGFDWGSAVAEEEALLEAEEEPAAKNPSIIDDYEEWHCLVCGAVHTRIGHTHQRTGFNPCNPWCPEPVRPEEPAAAMDDDSPRMQAIGQNGNNGEHYDDDPWGGAPEWAKYKAQQEHGAWEFYEDEPTNERGFWRHELRGVRSGEVGERNPNWRDTLITRT